MKRARRSPSSPKKKGGIQGRWFSFLSEGGKKRKPWVFVVLLEEKKAAWGVFCE